MIHFWERRAVTDFNTLRKWQLLLGLLLGAQGIAILLVSAAYHLPVYIAYLTSDLLQTRLRGSEVTAPAVRELLQVNLVYCVAAVLIVTALAYLLMSTALRQSYKNWLNDRKQPLRWVTTGFAGSGLLLIIDIIAGLRDITSLVATIGFTVLLVLSVYWLELQKSQQRSRIPVVLVAVAWLVPWLAILRVTLATNVFGIIAEPGYLWWMIITVFAAWLLMAVNFYLTSHRRRQWANYFYAEWVYLLLIFLAETAFTWQAFSAVLHP